MTLEGAKNTSSDSLIYFSMPALVFAARMFSDGHFPTHGWSGNCSITVRQAGETTLPTKDCCLRWPGGIANSSSWWPGSSAPSKGWRGRRGIVWHFSYPTERRSRPVQTNCNRLSSARRHEQQSPGRHPETVSQLEEATWKRSM